MGIPLLQRPVLHRAATPTTSAAVAIVDDTLVRRLFPGEEPLGKRIAFEFRGDTASNPDADLARDRRRRRATSATTASSSGPPNVQVYTPLAQLPI